MASIRARQGADGVRSYTAEIRYFKTAEAKKHTLGELIDRYVKEVLPTKPKAVSQAHQLQWFKEALGDYSLSEITTARLVQCRNQLASEITAKHKDRLRSPATVNRYLAALSHVFSIAVNDWEWIEDSPMRRVKKLPEPRGRVRFLSDDVVEDGELFLVNAQDYCGTVNLQNLNIC